MTESFLTLVPTYGLPFLFAIAVLAASGIPVSSSAALLIVGAFIATGDLPFVASFLTALVGAVIGDQIGYRIGGYAGNAVEERLSRKPTGARRIQLAKRYVDKYGGVGVFVSRWLLAPIGPTINIVCGASRMHWLRFTLWDFAGEAIWVLIYIGIGYVFRGNLEELAAALGNASWFLIAAITAVIMGVRLVILVRQHRAER